MINHALALLVNLPGPQLATGAVPGEAYLPAFQPRPLPGFLSTIRSQLFGQTPDRAMLFYRGRQLLQLLQGTPLWEYVLALDGRNTYLTAPILAADDLYQPQLTHVGGPATDAATVLGAPAVPDALGRTQYRLNVEIVDPATAAVTDNWRQVLTNNYPLASPVPLANSGYSLDVLSSAVGSEWVVDLLLRPQWDLAQLTVNLSRLGEATLLSLLGTEQSEPYSSCRKLWQQQNQLPLKLAAFVVLYLYRLEGVRLGG